MGVSMMNGRENETTEFSRIAETLGMSPAAIATAWGKLPGCNMSPDDPDVVRLLLLVATDEQAAKLARATKDTLAIAKDIIMAATKDAAKEAHDLIDTAQNVIKARAAHVSADIAAQMTDKIAAAVNKTVVQEAEQRGKESEKRSRSTRNSWAALTMAIAAGCSAAAAGGAWYAGRSTMQFSVTQIQTVLARGDGSAWAQMMAGNDMAQTLTTYCGAGSPNIRRLDGGTACTMPLWVHRDGVVGPVPGRTAELAAGMAEVRDALQTSLGTWGLLTAGAAAVLGLLAVARVRVVRALFGSKADASFGG